MPLKAHSVDNAPALMPDLYYRPKEFVSMGCGLVASNLRLKVPLTELLGKHSLRLSAHIFPLL